MNPPFRTSLDWDPRGISGKKGYLVGAEFLSSWKGWFINSSLSCLFCYNNSLAVMPEVMQVTLVHCLLLFVLLWIICQVTFHISSQIFKIISRKNLSVMDQSLAVFLAVTGGRLYSFMFATSWWPQEPFLFIFLSITHNDFESIFPYLKHYEITLSCHEKL